MAHVSNVDPNERPANYPSTGTEERLDTLHDDNGQIETKLDTLHTDLGTQTSSPGFGTGVIGWLQSIYNRLLATLSVSDSTTQGKLDTIHTDTAAATTALGTDGSGESPANGTGVRGWLRGIYDKLASTIAVTQSGTWTVNTNPPSHASTNLDQVNGTTVDTNSGSKSAGTQRVVLATDQPALTNALKTDSSATTQPVSAATLPLPSGASTSANQSTEITALGHLTDNTQTTKVTNGTQAADTRAGDNGQNQLLVAGARKELTATNAGVSSVDVSGYLWMSIQTVRTSGTLTPQFSNDNSNFLNQMYVQANNAGFALPSSGAIGASSVYIAPITGRYFQLVSAAYVGAVTIEFFTSPCPVTFTGSSDVTLIGSNTVAATQSGSWSAQAIATTPTTSLGSATTPNSGTAKDSGTACSNWAMQVHVTGSPSTCTVDLQLSNDAVTWGTVATWTLTPKVDGDFICPTDKPVAARYARAKLTALTGGTSPAVTATLAGTL